MSTDGWRTTFKKLHRSLSYNTRPTMPKKEVNELALKEYPFEDNSPLPPIKLIGFKSSTRDRLLNSELCEEVRTLLPRRIQLYTDWHLLYSLEQHGASLHSLYERVRFSDQGNSRVGYLLVIRDRKGGVFGAYANEPFHQTEGRRYYGNGECFLWKVDKVPNVVLGRPAHIHDHNDELTSHRLQFRGYTYTGINEFCIYSTNMFLSMGAGNGHYGLWCDEGLVHGSTEPSLTFGNDTLSREGKKFHIIGLEVWKVG
ncbi:HER074Cp [Eremothecium sinecaudum]|uniref:Oxidation resistance protein 1 n=1 Tax=Eremothecium sinecaudum TaxID=45286 RepID=A0A0X8HTX1_9SACH|nr:HER074Cp [Eremothecium sinecaudum]AMD21353.1 HER074Cp [Eremothecium sinecaudum]